MTDIFKKDIEETYYIEETVKFEDSIEIEKTVYKESEYSLEKKETIESENIKTIIKTFNTYSLIKCDKACITCFKEYLKVPFGQEETQYFSGVINVLFEHIWIQLLFEKSL